MAEAERVLIYKLRSTEALIDGRIYQTLDVLHHPGLVIRWKGWTDGHGNLSTDVQYFEVQDGRRFDMCQQDDAVVAWASLLPPAPVPMPAPCPPRDRGADEVRMRRFVARSVIPSRLRALDLAAIPYEETKPGQYRVYGDIEYYPATGFWRSLRTSAYGYTVDSLIAEARKQDSAKFRSAASPAAGAAPGIGQRAIEAPPPASADASHPKRTGSGITTASVTSGGGEQPRPSLDLLPRVLP